MNMQNDISPDYATIKAKQNAIWASGDYAVVGTTVQIVGETLAEAMNLRPPSDVLDVAAGNGNATMAFARRWHNVTSTDYVQNLLDKGRARAKAEGLAVDFQVADAEDLPFDPARFDAVVSTFGVMFAPNQMQAAAELMRVCKPGGHIGLTNWTPDGFIGQMLKTVGAHVPPPAGVMPPSRWGDSAWLQIAFADAMDIRITPKQFVFHYPSPQHFVDIFRTFYGPAHKAFQALDAEGQDALEADLIALLGRFNRSIDGSLFVPGEYLEVIVTR